MKNSFRNYTNIKFISIIIISLLSVSCVYFNTFYNAKLFFSEAEKLRAEKEGEFLGNNVTDKYKKVIEKSDIIINNYPHSKYLDDALYLKGRSHYYRREYDLSQSTFNTLLATNPKEYQILSEYWLALSKWKSGKPQPALDNLNRIISKTDEKELLAQIYKSQAEIFLELKQDSIAVSVLEQAAELTRTRLDKGQIYYRLAELAYKIQDYKRAIHHYNNVIKYSFSNDRIMEANLKIVQRYRDLNDLNRASKEIQSMLIDPEFSTIHGDLELELAKLQLTQNNNIAAIQILADIVVKYPNTEISAEAFYMLGEQSLLNSRDFVKADFYYKQIKIEAPKSIFNDYAKKRINELNKYKKSKDFLSEIDNKISKVDSLTVDHVV
ncbi:tetratricopeptide repeat protein, partial [Candidatus Neomarinimicrobiota bacterium]